MAWQDILRLARNIGASDVHFSSGETPWLRIDGRMVRLKTLEAQASNSTWGADAFTPILSLLQVSADFHHLDFGLSLPGLGRFRVNAFQQARGPSLAFRLISDTLPTLDALQAPACLTSWATQRAGLILVTGPTGCGKSTLLAALLQHINANLAGHILTLEDPIEWLHAPLQCLIQQRELGRDTPDFESGLRAALREDPDVILIGELRDTTTIRLALTAAETGHLVFGTIHAASSGTTINRILDLFPPEKHSAVRQGLANNLKAVIAQKLVKGLKKGRWDILIFDHSMKPFLLIECKSPYITLTEDVIYQAGVYNIALKAPYIAVTNGSKTSCFMIDKEINGFTFLTGFPDYPIT